MLENWDVVFYTLLFLVPGFIIDYLLRSFIPQKEMPEHKNILYYLCLSSINAIIWLWVVREIYIKDIHIQYPFRSLFIVLATVIFGSFITTFIIYKTFALIKKLSEKYAINVIHPIPTAWDYKFNRNEVCWVIVVLEDGSEIAGLFGTKSFASSDFNERDIFLEKICEIQDNGEWKEMNTGMYIRGDKIKLIQFYNYYEEEQNDRQE